MSTPPSTTPPPPGPDRPARRPDESMSLITELRERSLEPGYAAAAARRTAQGLPASTGVSTPLLVVTALLLGLLATVATQHLRGALSVVTDTRGQLVGQIESRRQEGDERSAAVAQVQREITALEAAALGPARREQLVELTRLEVNSGLVAVTGPGLTITLDDSLEAAAADPEPRGQSGTDLGRVSAADLQIVTNGLWAAGAEAICINGQRLTTHAAIRFAGQAVLVDFRPLARPYVVTAIGDQSALQTGFASGASGSYLKSLQDNYQVRVLVEAQSATGCPAGSVPAFRQASGRPGGIPSVSPSTGTPPPTRTTTETRR